MKTGVRPVGDFCWTNMLTPRTAEAREFYSSLLNWNYVEMPGVGYRVQVDGHDIGGLFDLDSPQTPPGTPAHIGVMVKVDSADKTTERVKALGGTAMPPFDVFDQGRMAVCFDPNGAPFDIWEPKAGPGMDADTSQHGATSWFESMTTDVDRASKFYAALFGWKPEAMPMPDFTYTTFKLGDDFIAGMMPILPNMGPMPPHWGTYFTVRNVDEMAGLAAKLGATLCVPPQDIPNVGRFCGVTSPQGVTFYVITYLQ
jgi:hypothetical protein